MYSADMSATHLHSSGARNDARITLLFTPDSCEEPPTGARQAVKAGNMNAVPTHGSQPGTCVP